MQLLKEIRARGPEKVTGTFCLKGPKGASHKRCLSPFPAPFPAPERRTAHYCGGRRPGKRPQRRRRNFAGRAGSRPAKYPHFTEGYTSCPRSVQPTGFRVRPHRRNVRSMPIFPYRQTGPRAPVAPRHELRSLLKGGNGQNGQYRQGVVSSSSKALCRTDLRAGPAADAAGIMGHGPNAPPTADAGRWA